MTAPDATPARGDVDVKVLYLFAHGEANSFHRDAKGLIVQQYQDELPDSLYEDSDEGCFVVFDGTIHEGVQDLTEAEREARGIPSDDVSFDVWWQGSMRPATDEEILAVFGNGALTAENDALRERVRVLSEGPDDAACDDIIENLERFWYYSSPEDEQRRAKMYAIVRAALTPEAK